MNQTQEMIRLREVDAQIKLLEAEKKSIREQVIPDLALGEYDGIKLTKKKIVKFHDDEFLSWVSLTFPNVLDKVTRPVVDYIKFEEYVARGEIVYDELPTNVFTVSYQDMITFARIKNATNS